MKGILTCSPTVSKFGCVLPTDIETSFLSNLFPRNNASGSLVIPVVKSVGVLVVVTVVLIGVYDSVNGSAVLLAIDLVAVVFVASL